MDRPPQVNTRPFSRRYVVLAVLLFCGGCWTGCYVAASRALSATAAEARQLEKVNQKFNWSIQYKLAKDYRPNAKEGDCKTYAATKRWELIAKGWAKERLEVWFVKDETRQAHAVLVADKALVLDNRFAWIEKVRDLETFGYRFLAVVEGIVGSKNCNKTLPSGLNPTIESRWGFPWS